MGGSPLARGGKLVRGAWVGLAVLACTAPVALFGIACASPVSLVQGRWRSGAGGASVADLAALEPGWERGRVDGSLLVFVAADGARAGWLQRCPGATAEARPEAHALLVRLEGVALVEEKGVELAGALAWMLRAEAAENGRAVQLKAVTRVAAGCTDDFLLVSPGDLTAHEAAFDRWWTSFAAGSPG